MADQPDQVNLNDLNAATKAASSLGLQLVRLKPADISSAALALTDQKLAREYRLIPFKLEESTKKLTIAIADPSLLSKPAPDFLQKLKTDGYTLELQVTPSSDFEAALSAYDAENAKVKTQNAKLNEEPLSSETTPEVTQSSTQSP